VDVSELVAGIIGGAIGAIGGVFGNVVTSYVGPRRLEEWRERRKEERHDAPRKRLLVDLLEDTRFPDGRYLTTLCEVTGTDPDECKRLLIELGARGVRLRDGPGWALISRNPLNSQ
jgi:hypothetical protein